MYKYITDPKTHKNYELYSDKGLEILQKYLKQTGGKCSICNKGGHNSKTCKSKQTNIKMVIKPKLNNKKITQIKGAVTFYFWDIKCPNNTNKKIILLGDEHTAINNVCSKTRKVCFDLDDFVQKIIKEAAKKNKCIDLFFEEKQKKKSAPKYLKGGKNIKGLKLLPIIRNKFYGCSYHTKKNPKKKCTFKNLRFHNFDLRFSNEGGYHRTTNKLDAILYFSKKNAKYNHNKDFSLLADYILGNTITKTNMKKIEKNIEVLRNSATINTPSYTKNYSISEIKKDMKNFRKLIIKEYSKYLKNKNKYLPRKKYKLRSYVKKVIDEKYKKSKEFYEYTHLFTDLYVLSRIFMEFSTDKNKISRSPPQCPIKKKYKKTENISPNKIIIIAGEDHIELYNKVLEYYFPKALSYKIKNYKTNKIILRKDILPKINSFTEIIDKFIE